jgi:hypothetical protein
MIVTYFLTGKQDGENPAPSFTLELSDYPRVGEYVAIDLPSHFLDSDQKTYYGEVFQTVSIVSKGKPQEFHVYLS